MLVTSAAPQSQSAATISLHTQHSTLHCTLLTMTLNTPHDSCFFTLLTDNVHLYNQHMLLGLGRIDSPHITPCSIYLLYQSVWEYIASVSRVSRSRHLPAAAHLSPPTICWKISTNYIFACNSIFWLTLAPHCFLQTCYFCFKLHLLNILNV